MCVHAGRIDLIAAARDTRPADLSGQVRTSAIAPGPFEALGSRSGGHGCPNAPFRGWAVATSAVLGTAISTAAVLPFTA